MRGCCIISTLLFFNGGLQPENCDQPRGERFRGIRSLYGVRRVGAHGCVTGFRGQDAWSLSLENIIISLR